MFQNSENFPSEKIFKPRLILVPDFNFFTVSYTWYTNLSLWPNFEMMASQHGIRISRFQEKSFINEYFTSKFLLLLIFFFFLIFLSPLVHEIKVRALFRANFGLMTSPRRVKTSKFCENCFINEEFTSK